MKTLHFYILRQILGTLLMTVMVFTFVLLLGNGLKEILPLLVSGQASLWLVLEAIGLLIPFVLIFALPMGMLTATLLVFGRLSADQELTAVRAGGISLIALISPILILSIFLSGCCAWINLELAPKCRVAYVNLRFRAGLNTSLLTENQPMQIGDYTLYIKKINGTNLQDVTVIELKNDTHRWFKGDSGEIEQQTNQIILKLNNAYGGSRDEPGMHSGQLTLPFNLNSVSKDAPVTKIGDMTFNQLREKIAELDQMDAKPLLREESGSEQLQKKMAELRAVKKDLSLSARVQLHRMVSFSFACIGFTLIGIPLGIRAHRKETSTGMAMALVLVLVYYSFIILGQSLVTRPAFAPHLIVWLPNFIFQAVGAVLLWRANKGV